MSGMLSVCVLHMWDVECVYFTCGMLSVCVLHMWDVECIVLPCSTLSTL